MCTELLIGRKLLAAIVNAKKLVLYKNEDKL